QTILSNLSKLAQTKLYNQIDYEAHLLIPLYFVSCHLRISTSGGIVVERRRDLPGPPIQSPGRGADVYGRAI
ncbi:hypothetical protein VNI00_006808, partial [Paramarasmius palmivorus]